MSIQRRALALTAAAAIGVVGLTACGTPAPTAGSSPTGGAPASPAEPVTLEFWDMAWGPAGVYDVKAQELVKKFNDENPGITVNYTLKTWDNWYQTFAQAVGADAAPDVSTGGGFQPFGLQADADAILPLNPLIDKWKGDGTVDDFTEGMLDYYLDADGNYLAVPWATDIRVWYYRTDLLEQAGVGVPTTYDELKAACDAVHTLGSDTYGIVDGGTPHWTFMQGIAFGAGMFDAQGNAAITSPKEMDALNYIASMGEGGSGCINPSATTITQDDAIALFDAGKAAFVMDSPSFGPHVSAETQKVTKVLPPLANAEGSKMGLYFVNGIMGYKSTEHPEETMKFIEYWSTVGGELMLAGASGVSPRKSIDSNPEFDKAFLYREAAESWGAPVGQPLFALAPNGTAALNTIDGDTTMLDLERALFSGQDVQAAAQVAQDKVQGFVDQGR